jgi:type VI protein secretion system component VasF
MDASFLRDFADRLRKLLLVARSEATRRQLALWIEEFEREAEASEVRVEDTIHDHHEADG